MAELRCSFCGQPQGQPHTKRCTADQFGGDAYVEFEDDVKAERDFHVRLFNRLEKAVSDHKAAVEDGDMTLPEDRSLYAAHERIMRDAAKGPHWRPEKRERPEAA